MVGVVGGRRPQGGGSPISGAAMATKNLLSWCFAFWIYGMVTINFHAIPALSQENVTETAMNGTTTVFPVGTTSFSDALMTSEGIQTSTETTEIQTDFVTEMVTEWGNTTVLLQEETTLTETINQNPTEIVTEFGAENVTLTISSTAELFNQTLTETVAQNSTEIVTELGAENTTSTMESTINQTFTETITQNSTEIVTELGAENTTFTTESSINQTITETITQNSTEIVTELGAENMTFPMESTMTSSDKNSSMPMNYSAGSFENDTAIGPTSETPNATEIPTIPETSTAHRGPSPTNTNPISPIIPIMIFAGLLFLLTIMIFIAVVTKSKMKRTKSTYHLTPAANKNTMHVGYRNTAYDQGDIADDTDVECSMRELRLEGKTTNGTVLKNPGGLEEELTAL